MPEKPRDLHPSWQALGHPRLRLMVSTDALPPVQSLLGATFSRRRAREDGSQRAALIGGKVLG